MAIRGGTSSSSALVAMLCLLPQLVQGATAADQPPLVPAVFVFGDSTVDVGNNNYLSNCNVDCKADHPRYGVDYTDQAPTGRFSNGYNMADQLAQPLGFVESPPPFLSLPEASRVPQIMSTGINFASGGSGILDDTGRDFCNQVMTLSEQVGNFSSLAKSANNQTVADRVSRSLFFISAGSNDIFQYVDVQDPPNVNATEFLQSLVSSYSTSLQVLYGAGARKFSVVSPSLVGCSPSQRLIASQRKQFDGYGCLAPANNLSILLSPMLDSMLQDLRAQMPGMNYSLGDSVRMAEWVFNNTGTANVPGLTVLDKACCGAGDVACNVSALLCTDRSSYLFWDKFHPTEAASRFTAGTLLDDDQGRFVRPINVRQLVTSSPHP